MAGPGLIAVGHRKVPCSHPWTQHYDYGYICTRLTVAVRYRVYRPVCGVLLNLVYLIGVWRQISFPAQETQPHLLLSHTLSANRTLLRSEGWKAGPALIALGRRCVQFSYP